MVQLEFFFVLFVLLPILVLSMATTGTGKSIIMSQFGSGTMLGTGQNDSAVSTVTGALVWLGDWCTC